MLEINCQNLLDLVYHLQKVRSQASGKPMKWSLTEKGFKHIKMSKNPFSRVILWDFDTHFQVHKLVGKKTQTYMFCDKCDAYLNTQPGFNFGLKKFVCEKCGHINDTLYLPTKSLNAENNVYQECPKCEKTAKNIDEIIVLFGFQKTEAGLQPYSLCKECRQSIE
ncbi:MAG: Sec23/Sec24 zinc finger-containing protein [Lachnospiraceae bacterium]|nr:Sec23/Sec24 zinc finger-containing protein [Lachnospiraceae bacterium]